jgi:hypothetical protein
VGLWLRLTGTATVAAAVAATVAHGATLGAAGGGLVGDDAGGYAGGGLAFAAGEYAEVEPGIVATISAFGLFGGASARLYFTDDFEGGLRPYATAGAGYGVYFGGGTSAAAPCGRAGFGLDIRPEYWQRTAFVEACAFSIRGEDDAVFMVLIAAGMRLFL